MSHQSLPIRVDIVSDVVCPWCAIGYYQLDKASRKTSIGVSVHWHPFELNPNMAPEGENLREHLANKYGTTPEGSQQARAHLTELGAGLGFTFNYADDMRMYNTFKAHQLIEWAGSQDAGHKMKLALLKAFFTHRLDLSDDDVLASAAGSIGLDSEEARMVLERGEFANVVRAKEHQWTQRGVRGVPAMVFEQKYLITGAQGEDAYGQFLRKLILERETVDAG